MIGNRASWPESTRDQIEENTLAEVNRLVVLFLCVHNAGRSQMAAAWLNHLAGDSVEVYSGGSDPAQAVNPSAVAAMQQVGIDLRQAEPKAWTDVQVRDANVVVTMGCGDECPIYPGKRYEDWDVLDPSGLDVGQVATIRDDIYGRVAKLMESLGLAD